MGFIPILERVGINKNDGSLDEGLGTNQLVIGGIVSNIKNTDLSGADLGSPGEVSRVQSKSTELHVSSSGTDRVDSLLSDTSIGGRASHQELSLLAELGATSSCLSTLVSSFTCDTLLRKEIDEKQQKQCEMPFSKKSTTSHIQPLKIRSIGHVNCLIRESLLDLVHISIMALALASKRKRITTSPPSNSLLNPIHFSAQVSKPLHQNTLSPNKENSVTDHGVA